LSNDARTVLRSIVATDISPELVPAAADGDREPPHQRSEDVVGPYELQDFHLYHVLRFGGLPSKIAFVAHHAWGDRARGSWPDAIPVDGRNEYDLDAIAHWLAEFLRRFFATSQFKR